MDLSTYALGFLIVADIYMLPWIIAMLRKHNDRGSIGILTFFFAWTFIGWIIALMWSFSSNVEKA